MVTERCINSRMVSTKGFEDLYPFAPHYLDINGHTLHYLDEGSGPPVLMVHGNPTWSFYFRNLVHGLSKDFRTLVPDHIGCGFSDKPDASAYDYTLASRVKDLDALVAHTVPEGRLSLIVHDWGGMIGLAWALDNLDRVDKLVITNTAGFFLPANKRFPLVLWLIKKMNWFAVPAILGANLFSLGALYLGASTGLSSRVKKGLTAPYNCWKNRIATLKFVQDIPLDHTDKSWEVVDRVDRHLTRLHPDQVLFLWGAKDFVFDTCFLDEFLDRLPGAGFHLFEDAGHYLFEDKPEETFDHIYRFFDKTKSCL
ncbi:MAG: alpha/beta fold hydrolase [Desulfotignum sp.]|nr:alpha/beta fold hydrolase [Desulfotignum sp.]MCF8125139.1 alpha/beta fold hydrolase [Desulfotignum sp.]